MRRVKERFDPARTCNPGCSLAVSDRSGFDARRTPQREIIDDASMRLLPAHLPDHALWADEAIPARRIV